MTYYHQRVLEIRAESYLGEHLSRQLMQAKRFIDNQFNEQISLADMAEEAFLSKFHFIRLFKKTYGQTPYQYLTMVRIENARRLLRANTAINEVCFAVGFDSVSSFTTLFKKITGVSPAVFQKKQFSKKDSLPPFRPLPALESSHNPKIPYENQGNQPDGQ